MRYLIFLFVFLGGTLFAGEREAKPATAIVIFGATGDLTVQKLVPALYQLDRKGQLPEDTTIFAIGRRDYSSEKFRSQMQEALLPLDEKAWNRFAKKLVYQKTDFDAPADYKNLNEVLGKYDHRLYFLATQPRYFPTIVKELSEHDLIHPSTEKGKWSRTIIEKPFGKDSETAIALQKEISKHLDQSQIYRIDHFLGKEGIQNLLAFRFEDGSFEPFWNQEYVDQVQVTLSEDIGIGSRAHFWEETGLLRDLVQNHLMQILTLATMEPPRSLDPVDVHDKKIELLHAVRPFSMDQIDQVAIAGQYSTGKIRGETVPGYREEKDVPADSSVETFTAAKLWIDNERWEGVPFYLRSGKRLPAKTTEISVLFKNGYTIFIRIQPEPGVFLRKEGTLIRLDAPSLQPPREAYEKLLLDCLSGDASLFVQADEQFASWQIWTPVLQHWSENPLPAPNYQAGTWGPKEAQEWTHWELSQ